MPTTAILPRGVIPPMTTPFRADGRIDLKLVAPQVDWMIGAGVSGLAVGGSTGEGHTLEAGELDELVGAATAAARGRVPVIAGIIVDSTAAAIRRGKLVAKHEPVALQVTPVHYLFRPTDDAMLEYFKRLSGETGMPIVIYNVVPWTYLSPQLLVRIMNEVPGVVGVKQSSGDLKLLADLLITAPEDRMIYSAVDALLYSSYALGAHGSIAALPTATPHASVELWKAVQEGNHAKGLKLHEKLLRVWNAIIADNLPACTRYAQIIQGLPQTHPRAPMPPPTEAQKQATRAALEGLGAKIVA